MHGFGGGPEDGDALAANLRAAHPGQVVVQVDLFNHNASLAPMWNQTAGVADYVRNATAGFPAYHLICHSQGGLLCRAVIESMGDHRVDHFVSIAGVQMGQYGIPPGWTALPAWILALGTDLAWIPFYTWPWVQDDLGFPEYWNDPHHHKEYLNASAFLAIVNNETCHDSAAAAQRRANFLSVGAAHFFGSPDDGTLEPWATALFQTLDPSNSSRLIPMKQQPVYTEDWFGLRSLHAAGRLTLTQVAGVVHHEWLSRKDVFDHYLEPLLR